MRRELSAAALLAPVALSLCVAARPAPAAEPAPAPAAEPARAPAAGDSAPDDRGSRSDDLFREGRRLLGDGDIAAACARFDDSYRLAPRGGTLLNLGLCHEEEGRLLAAQRELRLALEMARRDARADREPIATQHLAAVEGRLSWLRLGAPANVAEAAVRWTVDGSPIDPRQGRVPVEQGAHSVSAVADGFRPRTVTVQIGAAPEQRLVQVDALDRIDLASAPAPRAPNASRSAPVAAVDASAPAPPAAPPHDRGASRTLARIALVAGITGVAVSLGAGALALSRKRIVHEHCDPITKLCDGDGQAAASSGRAAVVVGSISFAVGVAGLAAWVFVPGGLLHPVRTRDHALGLSLTRSF